MNLRELYEKINLFFENNTVLIKPDLIKKELLEFHRVNPSPALFYQNSLVKIYERILRFYSENKMHRIAEELGRIALGYLPDHNLLNYYYANILFSASAFLPAAKTYLKALELFEADLILQKEVRKKLIIDTRYRLGICFFRLRKYSKAKKYLQEHYYYLDTVNLLESIKDEEQKHPELKLSVFIALNNPPVPEVFENIEPVADEIIILTSENEPFLPLSQPVKILDSRISETVLKDSASGDWILHLKENETLDNNALLRLLLLMYSGFTGIAVKTDTGNNEYRLFRKNAVTEKLFSVNDISIIKIKEQYRQTVTENNNYPAISLCMIVKNGEKHLLRTFESVSNLVNEIIVLDTGSTDKTKELVRSFQAGLPAKETGIQVPPAFKKGDLVVRLYETTWHNDFAMARNESLKYATGDWILFLDADEYLTPESIEVIKNEIPNPKALAYNLMIENITGSAGYRTSSFKAVRLFRNLPELYFSGRIHEQPTQSLTGYQRLYNLEIKDSSALIKHTGYSDDDISQKAKYERNLALTIDVLENDKLSPLEIVYYKNKLLYGYRSLSYSVAKTSGLIDEITEIINLHFNRLNFTDTTYLDFFINSVEFFIESKNFNRALRTIIYGLDIYHSSPYLLFYAAIIFFEMKNYPSCKRVCEDAVLRIQEDTYLKLEFFDHQSMKSFLAEKMGLCDKELETAAGGKPVNIYGSGKFSKTASVTSSPGTKPETGSYKLSACIIARNEEDFIEKCVKSVIAFVDEVIVLDTGSDDSTPELARQAGAKVYFYHWDGNFSNAKNKALEFATGDWVLSLDADEVLIRESAECLRELLKNSRCAAYNVTRTEVNEPQSLLITRLFRKNPEIYFEGPVHEQVNGSLVKFCDKHNMIIADSKLELLHYGYLPEVMEKKGTHLRNLTMLRKAVSENKEQPATIVYYKIKLAVELINMNKGTEAELQEAKEIFAEVFEILKSRQIIKDIEVFPPVIQWASTYSAMLISGNDYLTAEKVLDFGLEAFPRDLTLNYKRGNVYHHFKKYEKAIESFKECIHLYKTDTYNKVSFNDRRIITEFVPYMLGINYEYLGSYEVAEYWYKEAAKQSSDLLYLDESLEHLKTKTNKDKVSLCMIVKNEEKNLGTCLKSVKNLVDEIVVVDTGSTDLTVEIARKYGARVYHLPWANNFSEARNYCLELALYNWLIILDADEHLVCSKEQLKALIQDKNVAGYYLKMEDFITEEESRSFHILRLFRNIPALRYEGYLHEKLKNTDLVAVENKLIFKFEEETKIIHKGYLLNDIKANRSRNFRNIEAALQELEKNLPEDDEIKVKLKLAFSYFENKDLFRAELLFAEIDKYISDNPGKVKTYFPFSEFFINYSNLFVLKNNLKLALYHILKGLQYFPVPALYYQLASLKGLQGAYHEAIEAYEKCITLGKEPYYESVTVNKGILTYESLYAAGYCYAMLKNIPEAKKYFARSLEFKPDYQNSLFAMSKLA